MKIFKKRLTHDTISFDQVKKKRLKARLIASLIGFFLSIILLKIF